jgi:nicotinamide riboside kinase
VREYAVQKSAPLELADHGPIAHGQMELEDEYRRRAEARGDGLLIADTDLLSTMVYCAHYFGRCPPWIEDAARARQPDLYLLLDIDIPWLPDPVRDRGESREEMQALFRGAVERTGVPFVLIAGDEETRFARATQSIAALLVR